MSVRLTTVKLAAAAKPLFWFEGHEQNSGGNSNEDRWSFKDAAF